MLLHCIVWGALFTCFTRVQCILGVFGYHVRMVHSVALCLYSALCCIVYMVHLGALFKWCTYSGALYALSFWCCLVRAFVRGALWYIVLV